VLWRVCVAYTLEPIDPTLPERVLEVSGQAEGERGCGGGGDEDVCASDGAESARSERVRDGDVAVDGQ